MSGNYRVDVGTPPAGDHIWESRAVCFHGFRGLPSGRNDDVTSPEFQCLGQNRSMLLYPGGNEDSSEGMIAVVLYHEQPSDSICIEFYFTVKNSDGKEVARTEPYTIKFGVDNYVNWGEEDFVQRSTMIDGLVDGTLTIELWMRKSAEPSAAVAPTIFVPENPIHKNILEMFMEEESADVIFEVGGGVGPAGRSSKKAKTSATTFHAHRVIVKKMASTFAALCQRNVRETTTIPIADVEAGVFRLMLYYGYGGEISDAELTANAKELIDAADKYGMTSLKLAAEARYVQATTLGLDNILETLLYAHAKNCALLKETAMDFVVRHEGGVLDEVSLEELPSAMMRDLLAAVARGKREEGALDATHYHSMRVGTLRKKLHEKGLHVDGSREAMIALLKENS